MICEVSTVNDDKADKVFDMKTGRFANVEEVEPPQYLLVSDHETYFESSQ